MGRGIVTRHLGDAAMGDPINVTSQHPDEHIHFEPPSVRQRPSMHTIEFYKIDEPYGEFSNFAPFPIGSEGIIWPTTEHYFQAWKFVGINDARVERIRKNDNPMRARKGGATNHCPDERIGRKSKMM